VKIQNGFSLKPATPEAKAAQQDAALRDAAKMYENHFLNEMVKAMRSTVKQEDGLIKHNMGEKIFAEQLDQKYVDNWSQKGGVGLADMIYAQIKEKYFGADSKHIQGLKQMMPIAPKHEMHGIPAVDSIQMKAIPQAPGSSKLGYRFEVPSPTGSPFEVRAPMPGKIAGVEKLDQGWSSVKLDHGGGLRSELTFPGALDQTVTEEAVGRDFEAGQRLGILDSRQPALAWNLDLQNQAAG
jgi:flagellar protein FlgJ